MKNIKRYSIHTNCGIYLHFTTNNLQDAKIECDNTLCMAVVSEKYMAKSPFSNKITEHFRTIYANKHKSN